MIKSLGFFPSTKTTQYLPCKRFGFNQMISTFFGEKDSVQSISKHSLTAKLWPYKNLVKIWWLMRFSVCHVTFIYFSNLKLWNATLHKIWGFPLKISSVNVTKSHLVTFWSHLLKKSLLGKVHISRSARSLEISV